jgi:hypothetical protein
MHRQMLVECCIVNITAQLKDCVPAGESVQPGSESSDLASQSGRTSSSCLWCEMCIIDNGAGLVLSVLNGQAVNN